MAITSVIALMAIGIFSGTVVATSRQRLARIERAIAAEAARSLLEQMRDETFEQVFALYNSDPADDPAGPGTAPGHRFPIDELQSTAADGMVAEVLFPVLRADSSVAPGWDLVETFEDRKLGMPRDLNGDGLVDGEPRDEDYLLLPVGVRLVWRGDDGLERTLNIYTSMAGHRW